MFDIVIVGAGPAGIGLLSSLYRSLISEDSGPIKICLIDKSKAIHAGSLDNYDIPSDTRAEKFLTCLEGLPKTILSDGQLCDLQTRLKSYGAGAAPLKLVGEFFRRIGYLIQEELVSKFDLEVKFETEVLSAIRKDKCWDIILQSDFGQRRTQNKIETRQLVFACGAYEAQDKVETFLNEQDLSLRFLPDITPSSKILTAVNSDPTLNRLKDKVNPKVVILGGSHSAISVANKLLSSGVTFQNSGITLIHRKPLHVTIPNAQVARDWGVEDFGPEDICPKTQRVYALKGFRLDAANLLMAIKGIGCERLEKRIELRPLSTMDKPSLETMFSESDLIISALGYVPSYPPLRDGPTDSDILLNAPFFVNSHSQLLNNQKTVVSDCFAIGLATNYNLAGRFGEPSFTGQANGLVLWHKEIGIEIATTLISKVKL